MKRLVILSTQRSGSTMVCDDIAGTAKLGRPSEYFIRVLELMDKLSSEQTRALIEESMNKGKSENGVVAVKIMSNQVVPIGRAIKIAGFSDSSNPEESFYEYFQGAAFVRVVRSNKVAQAVSRVMARQTDVYHSADDTAGLEGMLGKVSASRDESKLVYDYREISKALREIESEEGYLNDFLRRFSIKPFEVRYESAAEDRQYVTQVADFLGVSGVALEERRLKKVSGEMATKWIEKFKAEGTESPEG